MHCARNRKILYHHHHKQTICTAQKYIEFDAILHERLKYFNLNCDVTKRLCFCPLSVPGNADKNSVIGLFVLTISIGGVIQFLRKFKFSPTHIKK